ncbi:MAG: ROK family transcriptional regulator [Actinobacteria bacterium]|nr:ROK family transcriptional regulator [Actinomycetota bacterium]
MKFDGTASSKLQKEINVSIIFNYLRENEAASRANISKNLKISAPAVSRVIDELIKDGYVIETEKIKTPSGKRPTQLKINPDKGYVIGIDLGKERIKLALTNFKGDIVERHDGEKITDNKDIIEKIKEDINEIIDYYCKENKAHEREFDLKAICVGVPAVVDANTGKVISAPLYGSWKDLDFKKDLSDHFGVPVFIENDVNLSALGEENYGQGKNYENVVYVGIGNGIGAGIILDNHLIRGSYGSAGEIGFTIINSENLGVKAVEKGYLEEFSSVESIKNRALKEIGKGRGTLISEIVKNDLSKIEPSTVCEAAVNGDVLAKEIISEVVKSLSIAFVNLILIINPQIIVLGGDIYSLPGVKQLFVDPMIDLIERSIPFKIPEIKLSSLGEDTGILGASFFAVESLLMREFPYKIDQETNS